MNNFNDVLDETIALWTSTRSFCIVTYQDNLKKKQTIQAIPEGIYQSNNTDFIRFSNGVSFPKNDLIDIHIVRSDNLPELD